MCNSGVFHQPGHVEKSSISLKYNSGMSNSDMLNSDMSNRYMTKKSIVKENKSKLSIILKIKCIITKIPDRNELSII